MKTIPFDLKSVHHVLQPSEAVLLCEVLRKHVGPIVLDLETTGLNEHWIFARVVTASFTLPTVDIEGDEVGYPQTYVVGLSHPDAPLHTDWRHWFRQIMQAVVDSGQFIIGQNIRFDIRWITKHTGINLANRISADTGLGYHLLDENQTASLKPRAMKEFGIESWIDFSWADIEKEQKKDPRYPFCPLLAERVDYFTMAIYNARDTYWTWRSQQLHESEMGLTTTTREDLMAMGMREEIEALRLGEYYQRVSVPAVQTLTAMEQYGMMLDQDWCRNRLVELGEITTREYGVMMDLLDEARTWTGLDDETEKVLNTSTVSFAPTALWFIAWAEAMCQHECLKVTAWTPEGRPSWGASVLKRLDRAGYRGAATLLAWRKADKEASFIRSWLELVGDDGRLHATYNYYKVVTGRLSAENPNTQQIPRGAKNAFMAGPGMMLVTADYSQIEMRVAAHIAQCQPMIEAFHRGDDLHRLMAAMIAGVTPENVDKVMRQQAKAANFGFLFGMGAEKFVTYAADSYDVDFTDEEAEKFRNAFFSTWTGMQEWHNRQRKYAREYGCVKSPLGRIRHLPDIYSKTEFYRGRAERQAINSPVQGMASDMMLIAASRIRRYFPLIRPVALVHDAILCEVPEARADEFAGNIKVTMENVAQDLRRLGCDFSVPLVADVAIGRSWGDCEGYAA